MPDPQIPRVSQENDNLDHWADQFIGGATRASKWLARLALLALLSLTVFVLVRTIS